MSLFGIPIIIPYDYYISFITTNLPQLAPTNDGLFIGYLLCNFAYLLFIYLFVKIVVKIVIFIKNRLTRIF